MDEGKPVSEAVSQERTAEKTEALDRSRKIARIRESYSLFLEGLATADTFKTALALRTIRECEKGEKYLAAYTNDDEVAVDTEAEFVDILDGMTEEKPGWLFETFFNPYLGMPDEMMKVATLSYYAECRCPATLVVMGVSGWMNGSWSCYPEELKKASLPYVMTWLKKLLEIISIHYDNIIADDSGNMEEDDGPSALCSILRFLVKEPDLEEVLEYEFSVLGGRIASSERKFKCVWSPFNTAVRTGNLKAFELFLSSGCTGDMILVYPEENTAMLDRLYSLNFVLPGTEKGKDAFYNTIGRFSPDREITERIIHPSYFTEGYGHNNSIFPIDAARGNECFPKENYDLLVPKPEKEEEEVVVDYTKCEEAAQKYLEDGDEEAFFKRIREANYEFLSWDSYPPGFARALVDASAKTGDPYWVMQKERMDMEDADDGVDMSALIEELIMEYKWEREWKKRRERRKRRRGKRRKV